MRLSLLLLILVSTVARADLTTTPDLPGDSYNSIPFGAGSSFSRYQQVHGASEFANPVDISSLAFSPKETGGLMGTIQFRLGVTSVAVGALSTDLDMNITAPMATVFSEPVSQTVTSAGHDSFSVVFPFTTPFHYDPNAGNLLVEMTMTNGGYVGQTYMMSYAPTTTEASRAWQTAGAGAIASGADSNALRIQMGVTTAVPEPSSILMLGCVGVGIGTSCYIKRRRRTKKDEAKA